MAGVPETGISGQEHSNFRADSSSFNGLEPRQFYLQGFEPTLNAYRQLPLEGFELLESSRPEIRPIPVESSRPETKPIPEIHLSELRLPAPGETLKDQLPFPLVDPAVRNILLDNGADEEKVNQVFNENGEWILYGKDDIPDLYSLPIYLVKQKLTERLSTVYDLVNYRLRADKFPHGYNGHDLNHIDPVVKQTQALLEMAGHKDDDVARMGIIAAMIHDLGNISRRDGHSYDSTAIALAVVPSLLQKPSLFESIAQAARLHDEKALKKDKGINGAGTAVRDTQTIKEIGPVLAAIVMADKSDAGRHRSNQWASNPEAMDKDDHAFINFFGENQGFSLEETKGGLELVWRVQYRPDVTKEEYERFAPMAKDSKSHEDDYAAIVPKWVQEAYRMGRTSHFEAWAHTTFRTYDDRIKLIAKCAMALLDIDYFTVEMHDPINKNNKKAGTRYIETFDRELLNKHEKRFDLMYVPYEVRKKRANDNKNVHQDEAPNVVFINPEQESVSIFDRA